MVIADMGSVRPGVPTLTVGLRGMAAVIVELRTLAGPKHSGQFGGAGPDALIALMHALATLHDENGDVAVDGPAARALDGRVLQRRGVPRPGRDRAGHPVLRHGRAGRAALVGPGATVTGIDVLPVDARRERGRAVRAREGQHPHPSRRRTRPRPRRRSSATSRRSGRSGSR